MRAVAAGDLNGDGHDDLVALEYTGEGAYATALYTAGASRAPRGRRQRRRVVRTGHGGGARSGRGAGRRPQGHQRPRRRVTRPSR
ncbi:FG-GAP repeat protein [Streptomyces montanisoli]|uniref:FG-GAP repeat protein n=1 Tax=Streptomyces montanisoli TaxID=2798581 RepID=A0A940M9R9_9ACTN|nr:FG-GAP repeat protein [Streptomyces montanisoli]